MDVYRRIHGEPCTFFIPDDFQISLRNLRWIVSEAQRWRGADGSRRQIRVTSIAASDHMDSTLGAHALHLAVYTQTVTGDQELYRQFLRRPDGAIVELFDIKDIGGTFNVPLPDPAHTTMQPNLVKEMLKEMGAETSPTSPPLAEDLEMQPLIISGKNTDPVAV